jgi:hypothetical protein
LVAHSTAHALPWAHDMTALAGGGLQHIAFPQTSTLGEAQVHEAGVPLQVGVPPPQVVVHAPQ